MTALSTLLELQDHDTRIDQLRHRRDTLPEKAELTDLERRRVLLVQSRNEVAERRDEVATRQSAAENEVATSEKRIQEIDQRMVSGAVTASRDLQAMQHEIDSIKERISHLEDTVLEAMEEREPLDAQVEGYDEQLAAISDSAVGLREKIVVVEAEIDGELALEVATRSEVAGRVPGDLASTYERLRSRLGGTGAARLDGNRCSGCHLTLPATELDRLKHQDPTDLVFCEQCGRILVRIA